MSKAGGMEFLKEEIWEFFKVVGKIENIYIPQRRNKEGKIFGFVRFTSWVNGWNGCYYKGSKLRMNIARFTNKKEARKPKGIEDDRRHSKQHGIVGVMNDKIRKRKNEMVWIISTKRGESEEIEEIFDFLKIKWGKVGSKGKNCFLVWLNSIQEKDRV